MTKAAPFPLSQTFGKQKMKSTSKVTSLLLVAWIALLSGVAAFCSPTASSRTQFLSTTSVVATSPPSLSVALFATKKKSKKKGGSTRATRNTAGNRQRSASGFGGAAVEPCPCGSGEGYMACCGRIHKNADAYGAATPEQVVRARYSAYAKRDVDFIVGSTHPLNKKFNADIEQMKEDIRVNCYDNFELKECNIISEDFEGEGENQIAKVQFIATMTQVDSREKTSFMETSTFERAGKHIRQGAWLYRDGVVEAVPTEDGDESADEEGEDADNTED